MDVVLRGEAAGRLLKDDTAMSALGEVERECFETWAATNPADTDTREFQYRMLKAVELLQDKLETWVQQGDHVRITAEQAKREASIL